MIAHCQSSVVRRDLAVIRTVENGSDGEQRDEDCASLSLKRFKACIFVASMFEDGHVTCDSSASS